MSLEHPPGLKRFIESGWVAHPSGLLKHFGMRATGTLTTWDDGSHSIEVFHVGRGGGMNHYRSMVFQDVRRGRAWAFRLAREIALDRLNWCGLSPVGIDRECWQALHRSGDLVGRNPTGLRFTREDAFAAVARDGSFWTRPVEWAGRGVAFSMGAGDAPTFEGGEQPAPPASDAAWGLVSPLVVLAERSPR
jgi:hypothetical protein